MSNVDNDIAIINGEIDLIIIQLVSLESYLSEELLADSGASITNLKNAIVDVRGKVEKIATNVDEAAASLRSNYVSG